MEEILDTTDRLTWTQSILMFLAFLAIWFLLMWYVKIFHEPNWVKWGAVIVGIVFAFISVPLEFKTDEKEQKEHIAGINSIAFTIATVSLGMTYLLQSKTIETDDVRQFYPLILLAFIFAIISVAVYNGKWIKYQILITIFSINLSIACLIVAVFIALHSISESAIFSYPEGET